MAKMTQQQLETHLWGAAKILRGKTAGQDYKTYILTLMFFKRLSDQWDFEADEIIAKQEKELGVKLNEGQRRAVLKSSHVHRFTIPPGYHWTDMLTVFNGVYGDGWNLSLARRKQFRGSKT